MTFVSNGQHLPYPLPPSAGWRNMWTAPNYCHLTGWQNLTKCQDDRDMEDMEVWKSMWTRKSWQAILWKDNDMGRIMTNKNEGRKHGLTYTILSDDNIKWGRTWIHFVTEIFVKWNWKHTSYLSFLLHRQECSLTFAPHTRGKSRQNRYCVKTI